MTVKREIDKETEKQLLGNFPMTAETTVNCTIDIPQSKIKPVFSMRGMMQSEKTQRQHDSSNLSLIYGIMRDVRASLQDRLSAKDEYHNHAILYQEKGYDILRACIKGWSCLIDATGKTIEFKQDSDGKASKEIFDSLPEPYKVTLIDFMEKISGLQPFETLSLE